MKKWTHLTQSQKVDIINEYSNNLTPMITLAKKYGVTRQAIYKILKSNNVDTKKCKMPVSCTTCGAEIQRTKARIRKQLHHFCSSDCYYAFLEAGNGHPYINNRHGQRIGREVVSRYFQLQAGHIVHHKDRNTLNNDPHNLQVFANRGDHTRFHRGFDVEPLFDGTTVKH